MGAHGSKVSSNRAAADLHCAGCIPQQGDGQADLADWTAAAAAAAAHLEEGISDCCSERASSSNCGGRQRQASTGSALPDHVEAVKTFSSTSTLMLLTTTQQRTDNTIAVQTSVTKTDNFFAVDASPAKGKSPCSSKATPSSKVTPICDEGSERRLDEGLASDLRVSSLNLGGRNTNCLEFLLIGDPSPTGKRIADMQSQAAEALNSTRVGPRALPEGLRKEVNDILDMIYDDGGSHGYDGMRMGLIADLLEMPTWGTAYMRVRNTRPGLFNALNLETLVLSRPSVFEAPQTCQRFQTAADYLAGWREWYRTMECKCPTWRASAARMAQSKDCDLPTAFAGLLIFDLMCLCVAYRMEIEDDANRIPSSDLSESEEWRIPFATFADFAKTIPFANFSGKHDAVVHYLTRTGAHVLLAQEARHLSTHSYIQEHFLPPFSAVDEFTQVLLRRDTFTEATSVSHQVCAKMLEYLAVSTAPGDWRKAWQSSSRRITAVRCRLAPNLGGQMVCLASVHCARRSGTVEFLERLKTALEELGQASLYVVGVDSNVSGEDAVGFLAGAKRLGMEVGTQAQLEQVTVAKQRTFFQTQTAKAGQVDISHKDYILSWQQTSRLARGATSYTPDLWSGFGISRDKSLRVRLPTSSWPFDHCGVDTLFRLRKSSSWHVERGKPGVMKLGWRQIVASVVALLIALIALSPFASPCRSSPLAPSGGWVSSTFTEMPHHGICEVPAPCPPGGEWSLHDGSCYSLTPRLGHEDASARCETGYLADIASQAENDFVTNHVCPMDDVCWIGLEQPRVQNGHLTWASGAPLEFNMLKQPREKILPLLPYSLSAGVYVRHTENEICGCSWYLAWDERWVEGGGRAPFIMAVITTLSAMAINAQARPVTRSNRLTEKYLRCSLVNNMVIMITAVWLPCFHQMDGDPYFIREWLYSGSTNVAHAVLALILQFIIIRRLGHEHQVWLMRRVWQAECFFVATAFTTVIVFLDKKNRTDPTHTPLLVAMTCYLSFALMFFVFVMLSTRQIWRAWQAARYASIEGVQPRYQESIKAAARAAHLQFVAIAQSNVTGLAYYIIVLTQFATSRRHDGRPPEWVQLAFVLLGGLDTICNDVCAHMLAIMLHEDCLQMAFEIKADHDDVSKEMAHHDIARALLQAAPTSSELAEHIKRKEETARAAIGSPDERQAFLALKSCVRVEDLRLNNLMKCVRMRYCTMPMRFSHLVQVPSIPAATQQPLMPRFMDSEHRPEVAEEYLRTLLEMAEEYAPAFFEEVSQVVHDFNGARWPSELGLDGLPFVIWRQSSQAFRHEIAIGEVLHLSASQLKSVTGVAPAAAGSQSFKPRPHLAAAIAGSQSLKSAGALAGLVATKCVKPGFVVELEGAEEMLVHFSGEASPWRVHVKDVTRCGGAAVLVPGPLKSYERCVDKIAADYQNSEIWPPACNLMDIVRCTIVVDDPYSAAVLVQYLQKRFNVVRLKNRFEVDEVVPLTPERLEEEFFAVHPETGPRDVDSNAGCDSHSAGESYEAKLAVEKNYRDVMLNLSMTTPSGQTMICEVQVTLSDMFILKKCEQKIYTLMRMRSPSELLSVYAFSDSCQV